MKALRFRVCQSALVGRVAGDGGGGGGSLGRRAAAAGEGTPAVVHVQGDLRHTDQRLSGHLVQLSHYPNTPLPPDPA